MPFSDLFSSETIQKTRGHFSAIVRVAHADGNITEQEQKFLDKLAVVFKFRKKNTKKF